MESENKEIVEQAPPTGGHTGEHGAETQASRNTNSAPEATVTTDLVEGASTLSESVEVNPPSDTAEPQIISRASPALLQAILLASGEPVSFIKLQEIMRCDRSEVMVALDALRQHCATDSSGVEVVVVGERLQLRTKVAFAEPVRELLAVKPRKLSQAALETLSVVAYQQPIVKSEIDKIRGVDVAPTLKTLLERKIIKIIGYQASVGQPALYGTTDDFLRIFGLSSLSELPALRDLRALAKEPGEVGESVENDDADGVPPNGEEEGESSQLATSTEEIVVVAEVANNDEASVSNSDQQTNNEQPEVGNT